MSNSAVITITYLLDAAAAAAADGCGGGDDAEDILMMIDSYSLLSNRLTELHICCCYCVLFINVHWVLLMLKSDMDCEIINVITGPLMCVCNLFAYVYTLRTSVKVSSDGLS